MQNISSLLLLIAEAIANPELLLIADTDSFIIAIVIVSINNYNGISSTTFNTFQLEIMDAVHWVFLRFQEKLSKFPLFSLYKFWDEKWSATAFYDFSNSDFNVSVIFANFFQIFTGKLEMDIYSSIWTLYTQYKDLFDNFIRQFTSRI